MGADAGAEEQFGPYLVYERLGIGGMATVHRALERGIEGFERVVALKRLLPHLAADASFIKSFVREAKLASLLNHVNIVRIFECGRVGTQYFISMEYIDGRDIRRILRHARNVAGPPPINVTTGILLQLCEALDYAHSKTDDDGHPHGLVHRDVSPSNVLVTSSGHVKVIDFGIAKAQSAQLRTQTGRVKGKLAYMAPEALVGKDLDARSDLFAAGVIAHELLTARPLFATKSELETLSKLQRADDIALPSTYNSHCPPELDAIVMRVLAREPDERFANASELRDALLALRKRYSLPTSERDIAEWLDWAFELAIPQAPAGRASAPSAGPPSRPSRPKRSESQDDELVDAAWGGADDHGAEPVVLPDVPDVSDKHLSSASALGAEVRLDLDDFADDPPAPGGVPREVARPEAAQRAVAAALFAGPSQRIARPTQTLAPRTSGIVAAQTAREQAAALANSREQAQMSAGDDVITPRNGMSPVRTRPATEIPLARGSRGRPRTITIPPRVPSGSIAPSEVPSGSAPSPLPIPDVAHRVGIADTVESSIPKLPFLTGRAEGAASGQTSVRASGRLSGQVIEQAPFPGNTALADPDSSDPPLFQDDLELASDTIPVMRAAALASYPPPNIPAPAATPTSAQSVASLLGPPGSAGTAEPAVKPVSPTGLLARPSTPPPLSPNKPIVAKPRTSEPIVRFRDPTTPPPIAAAKPEPELDPDPAFEPTLPAFANPAGAASGSQPLRPIASEPAFDHGTGHDSDSDIRTRVATWSSHASPTSPRQKPLVPGQSTGAHLWLAVAHRALAWLRARPHIMLLLGAVVASIAIAVVLAIVLSSDRPHASAPARRTQSAGGHLSPAVQQAPPSQAGKPLGSVHFVVTPPDAAISIAGQPPRTGSPWTIELAPGSYQIAIQRAGYKGWLSSIDLAPGQIHPVQVTLEPLGAAVDALLIITSTPPGLEVVIDGKPVLGRTPSKLSVTPGSHSLVLRRDGAEIWRRTIDTQANSVYELRPIVEPTAMPTGTPAATVEPAADGAR